MAAAMPSSENKGSVWGTSLELLAGDEIRHNPARAQALVQQTSGHSADLVVGGGPHHRYVTARPTISLRFSWSRSADSRGAIAGRRMVGRSWRG
jgi:hypothetical protein